MASSETAPGEGGTPDAEIRAAAPGRINLIGEHIDYLGGMVMPVAIDRHIRIEASPLEGSCCDVLVEFAGSEKRARLEFSALRKRGSGEERWLNYLIGILRLTAEEGNRLRGFSARITSNLPSGAGLSSSAALETAFSLVVDHFAGVDRSVRERARLCQRAEHEYAGVPCGIMDQIAVGAARSDSAILLDCGSVEWSHVTLPASWSLLIADTGVKHHLGDGEYRKRRQQCDAILDVLGLDRFQDVTLSAIEQRRTELGELLYRRARHVLSEMDRVGKFAKALSERDREAVGIHLRDGHDSLRDDYGVSCAELDSLVEAAYDFGVDRGLIGSRMTGGGFGGSTISLVERDAASLLQAHLRKNYLEKFGRELDCFVTRPVGGASVELVQPSLVTP